MLSPISGFHMPGLQYILRLGSFMIPINIMIPMTLFISSSEAFFTWREPPLVITCCRVQSQTWFFAIDCSCHRLNNSSGLEFLLLPAKLGLRRRGISLILPEFVGCVHSFGPFKHNLFFLVWLQYKPRQIVIGITVWIRGFCFIVLYILWLVTFDTHIWLVAFGNLRFLACHDLLGFLTCWWKNVIITISFNCRIPTGPGKSWNLLIFLKNPGKALEFYKIFVQWIFFSNWFIMSSCQVVI